MKTQQRYWRATQNRFLPTCKTDSDTPRTDTLKKLNATYPLLVSSKSPYTLSCRSVKRICLACHSHEGANSLHWLPATSQSPSFLPLAWHLENPWTTNFLSVVCRVNWERGSSHFSFKPPKGPGQDMARSASPGLGFRVVCDTEKPK